MLRIDLDQIQELARGMYTHKQQLARMNSDLASMKSWMDPNVANRSNIRGHLHQAEGKLQELEDRIGRLTTYLNQSVTMYSTLEADLLAKALAIDEEKRTISPHLQQGQSPEERRAYLTDLVNQGGAASDWARRERIKLDQAHRQELIRQIQAGGAAGEWAKHELDQWDRLTSTSSKPAAELRPFDPDKSIPVDDILNRGDPEVAKRLFDGPFGRMTPADQLKLIQIVEEGQKEYEKNQEKYIYGHSFADGFGRGIQSTLDGLVHGVSHTVQHPIQTGQALFRNMKDSVTDLVNDPFGVIKQGYTDTAESIVRFVEASPSKKGHAIGGIFTSAVLLRGADRIGGKLFRGTDSERREHKGEDSGVGDVGDIQYKKISETSAIDVNKWWKEEMGYDEPPYKPGTITQEIELSENTTFVRVYDGENSGMYGGWFIKGEDIKGLTPAQIQDKFALPTTPKYVVDLKLDAGTRIRTGSANPLFGQEGGGQQFDLMGHRVGNFTNSRPLSQRSE